MLRLAAWFNAVLHAIGLAFALFALRPGTPAAPLPARMAYLAANPWPWSVGWLAWVACAVALAAFMVLLARERRSGWTTAAAVVAMAAALVDVVCDLGFIHVLPRRAAAGAEPFLSFERPLTVASLTVANGLYTAAVALAATGLGAQAGRAAMVLAALTVAGGTALAAGGLTGRPVLVAAATAVTIPSFVAWTLVLARR